MAESHRKLAAKHTANAIMWDRPPSQGERSSPGAPCASSPAEGGRGYITRSDPHSLVIACGRAAARRLVEVIRRTRAKPLLPQRAAGKERAHDNAARGERAEHRPARIFRH